ncbi:hypothetical protein [Burkholderia arboris]|uniref:hypothetical protein n=1 Tax=Burkholderia arboris TaxID=488730 RepID=UPI003182CE94
MLRDKNMSDGCRSSIWSKARGALVAVSKVDTAGGKGKPGASGAVDRRGEAIDGECSVKHRAAAARSIERMRQPSMRAVVTASIGIFAAGMLALGYAQAQGSVTVNDLNCNPAAAFTNSLAAGCSANAAGSGATALGFAAGAGVPLGSGASVISAAIASRLPGPGSIYLSQDLQFRRPVKLGETVCATVTIKEILGSRRRVVLDTRCEVNGLVVVEGTAVVMPTTVAERAKDTARLQGQET